MPERYDEELFLGFLEGDLTPERTAQFEKLLSEDAQLRNLVAQLVLDRHRLRHMPTEIAPDEIMERVNQRLERQMLLDLAPGHKVADAAPIRRFHLGRLLAYVGIAALVILGVSVMGYSLFNPRIHNLATDSGRREPGMASAPLNNSSQTTMAQSGVEAGRSTAFSEFSRLGGAPEGSAPFPNLTGGSANSQAPNHFTYQRFHPSASGVFPTEDLDDGLFQAPDAIANFIAGKLTGIPFHDTTIPSLVVPDEDAMSRVARASIPEFEQLMADNPEKPMNGAETQASDIGIFLQAAKPDVSEKVVRAWAIRNDLRILDSGADMDAKELQDQLRNGAGGTPLHARRLVLLMERRQVAELVSHLNLDAGQSARITPLAVANASSINEKLKTAGAISTENMAGERPVAMARSEPASPAAQAADAEIQPQPGLNRDAKLAYPYAQVAVPIYITSQ